MNNSKQSAFTVNDQASCVYPVLKCNIKYLNYTSEIVSDGTSFAPPIDGDDRSSARAEGPIATK
jgi:hypothetical protein